LHADFVRAKSGRERGERATRKNFLRGWAEENPGTTMRALRIDLLYF
jgi:hypothetical protein